VECTLRGSIVPATAAKSYFVGILGALKSFIPTNCSSDGISDPFLPLQVLQQVTTFSLQQKSTAAKQIETVGIN